MIQELRTEGVDAEIGLREAQWNAADLQGIWGLSRQAFPLFRLCSFQEFFDLWQHRWIENPARTAEHVFGWVLESGQEGIVGYLGLVPVRFKIGDQEVVGGTPHSWAVKRAHATQGLNLYKQMVAWGDRHLLIQSTAGAVVSNLNSRINFGFQKIPVQGFDRRFLWLIRPEIPALWKLQQSPDTAWCARAPVGRWLVTAAARGRYFRHRRIDFKTAGLPVEPVAEFTDEFAQLWEEIKDQYGVTTVRDLAFLRWRHLKVPPVFRTTHVLACRERGRLRGYLALTEPLRSDGYSPNRWQVTDLFYDRTRPDVCASLMNRAFALAQSRGCALFEVSQVGRELAALMESQHPLVKQAETWNYWYKAPSPELTDLCQREVWWPSGVDGDSNL